jgi:hypothetical protein
MLRPLSGSLSARFLGFLPAPMNGRPFRGQETHMRKEDGRYIDTGDEPDFAEEHAPSATDPPNAEPDDENPDERWDRPTEV